MVAPFRMTLQTQLVLRAMLDSVSGEFYGFELSKATDLKAGTLYPMLARLEEAGWISGSWEDVDPSEVRRPARRYYRLTDRGRQEAEATLTQSIERLAGVAFDPRGTSR